MQNQTHIHAADGPKESREFESLFRAHYQALVRYAFTILKNQEEAEDRVQHVFVNFWEKGHWKQVHTSAQSMLYTAVYHACLNRIKQVKVRQAFADHKAKEPDFGLQQTNLHEKELSQQIEIAMQQLPQQCRRIFELSRYHNLKYQEIAKELNLSIKTVENQMGKALKLMRVYLKDFIALLFLYLSNT